MAYLPIGAGRVVAFRATLYLSDVPLPAAHAPACIRIVPPYRSLVRSGSDVRKKTKPCQQADRAGGQTRLGGAGNPAISAETRGFASPSRDGFALCSNGCFLFASLPDLLPQSLIGFPDEKQEDTTEAFYVK